MNENECGVYQIRCLANGKVYIGSSINLHCRWIAHQSKLNRNVHPNCYLQAAWVKYGATQFVFEVIELTTDLLAQEEYHLKLTSSAYNLVIAPVTRPNGHSPSVEQRAKVSAKLKGIPKSAETKARMAKAQTGKRHSVTTIEKCRLASTGKKHTAEHCAKISAGVHQALLGKKLTAEHRAKISAGVRQYYSIALDRRGR